MKYFLVFAFVAATSAAAFADEAPASKPDKSAYSLFNPVPSDQLRDMDTDRPNKTNTPHTIDPGHVQLEFGAFDYTYDRDRLNNANARTDALSIAQFNFRLGISDNIELNAVVNAWDFQRNTDHVADESSRQNGFGDTIVGGKINLWGNDGAEAVWAAALGLQPQIKIPTARENLGNGHPEYSLGVPLLMNLPADFRLSLQTTFACQRSTANTQDVAAWQNAASVDRVVFEKFDFYLEYWSQITAQRHTQSQQTLDVGVSVQLDRNLALDTGVNLGLTKASTNLEWLAGMTVRF